MPVWLSPWLAGWLSGHGLQDLVDSGYLQPQDVRVCMGDCGWLPGQLEAEVQRGTWALLRCVHCRSVVPAAAAGAAAAAAAAAVLRGGAAAVQAEC